MLDIPGVNRDNSRCVLLLDGSGCEDCSLAGQHPESTCTMITKVTDKSIGDIDNTIEKH